MESKLGLIKEFLESIPSFIKDLDYGNDYLKVENTPDNIYKALINYSVDETENEDGYKVTGKLAAPLLDLIMLSAWHEYRANYPSYTEDRLYAQFLNDHPNYATEFNLEDFCYEFSDFYLEFLSDSGIDEKEIEIEGNTIILKSENIDLVSEDEDYVDTDENDEDYVDTEYDEEDVVEIEEEETLVENEEESDIEDEIEESIDEEDADDTADSEIESEESYESASEAEETASDIEETEEVYFDVTKDSDDSEIEDDVEEKVETISEVYESES